MGIPNSILYIFMMLLHILVQGCPPEESLAPHCTCKDFTTYNMMLCNGIFSPQDLLSPLREVASRKFPMFSITITNSSLMYIPSEIFKDTGIEKIRFTHSQVLSLSDTDLAFVGLEDTLTELRATEAHYIAQWDWQQLRNLKKISLIDVNWISLQSIDEAFPELPELSYLGIISAEISFMVDNAFSTLKKLKVLNMQDNAISELKRSMFPDPANNLMILDFTDNQLSNLPEDFFTNMPNLDQVHLNKNKFITLTEKPFSTMLSTLQELRMAENPFRCDCRMRWLVGKSTPHYFTAICSAPDALKGIALNQLDLKSLWC